MLKAFITTVVAAILFLLLLSLLGFYQAIRPFKINSKITPKNFGIPYEEVKFYTSDQVLIQGWFIASPNPKAKTIILLHGYPADKGNILPSRIFLYPHFNLLFFDFRYLGASGGKYSTLGKNEVLDLKAAIDFLHKRGIKNGIGAFGFSLGGSVALMTAAQNSQLKALAIDSAYARLDWMAEEYYRIPLLKYPLSKLTQFWAWLFLNYHVQDVAPYKSAEQLSIPILLIFSEQDNVISFRHALLLKKALQHNPHAQFIFVKSLLHGEQIKNIDAIIKKFFDENLEN